jgi:XTP/dITP diphosphohydrolase|uniref:dITP/XTP pyrophosphatase n=1 Tax=Desulfobacca acetoxidans TaxID=60893 RepID=A0A7V6A348_9BACT
MALLTLVMATRNRGKVRELAELLRDLDVRLLSLADFPEIGEIPEEGATFAENAAAKARTVSRLTGLPALADDSGLEVEALGGRPGVLSARYAQDRTGERPPKDADNWQKLLDELKDVPNNQRQARFVCEIALSFPDGRLITTRGELAGVIATAPRGTWGFGYDPVFYLPEYQAMVAELDLATKNRISHRGEALQKLKKILAERQEEFFAAPSS